LSKEPNNPFSIWRLWIPILLGAGVLWYLLEKQMDWEHLQKIDFSKHFYFFLSIACILVIVRHIAFSYRLQILLDKALSFKRCILLMILWEFSAAVAPTSVGGTAIALFLLTKEKLSSGKIAVSMIAKVILDGIFFVGSVVLLFIFFGCNFLRPELSGYAALSSWSLILLVTLLIISAYNILLYLGIFYNPSRVKKFLFGVASFRYLSRFKSNIENIGEEIEISAIPIRNMPIKRKISLLCYTWIAWVARFATLVAIIACFIDPLPWGLHDVVLLTGRSESLWLTTALSPTPGSTGVVDLAFTGFFSDYLNPSVAILVIVIWRLLTYYIYLIFGAVALPFWSRSIRKEPHL